MRENSRLRGRYDLSLDGKQVAAVVGGALVVVGAVFLLGVSVGRQLGASAAPAPPPVNPLAALDRAAPVIPPREPKLSFHDALTRGPADGAPIPQAKPGPRPEPDGKGVGSALKGIDLAAPAAAPGPPPPPPPPAAAAPREPRPPAQPPPSPTHDPMAAAVDKVRHLAPAAKGGPGRFSIQVGASRSEADARRLARRHQAEGAWVATADLPGKGRVYRVKLGSFATRAEAERRLAELERGGVKGFVTDAR